MAARESFNGNKRKFYAEVVKQTYFSVEIIETISLTVSDK